jgi:Phytanoyl-CoA dioxygenase (PhyH)
MITFIKNSIIVRIFMTDKLIKAPFLNKMGLQVWRIKLANLIFRLKSNHIHKKYEQDMSKYFDNGYIQLDGFLSDEEFAQVKKEFLIIKETEDWRNYKVNHGPNQIYMFDLNKLDRAKYPSVFQFLNNEKLVALFCGAEKKNMKLDDGRVAIQFQYLVQGSDENIHDPETDLHADTFFNTNKAWLYFDDVEVANAPFVYVPQTNKMSLPNRLEREYNYSLEKNVKGSRRVTQEEMVEIGLEEKVFTCKANTLVMANTLGYHRRLRGKAGYDRLTLAISVRFNPFNPF